MLFSVFKGLKMEFQWIKLQTHECFEFERNQRFNEKIKLKSKKQNFNRIHLEIEYSNCFEQY